MTIDDLDKDLGWVDDALASWRQGDCVLEGDHQFVHLLDSRVPVTDRGGPALADGVGIGAQKVAGFTLVTQTCDIVRTCTERPFVAVSPLVEVDRAHLRTVQRGLNPRHAFLPSLQDHNLVVDLDRVMTVEKPLVAKWERTPGWFTDAQARDFAQALTRKHARFAFPDDFTSFIKKLRDRLVGKHDKATTEGLALRALRGIRFHAQPSWDAQRVAITSWLIRHQDNAPFGRTEWDDLLLHWQRLLPPSGRFVALDTHIIELQHMSALEYIESDPLDLDHLSTRPAEELARFP